MIWSCLGMAIFVPDPEMLPHPRMITGIAWSHPQMKFLRRSYGFVLWSCSAAWWRFRQWKVYLKWRFKGVSLTIKVRVFKESVNLLPRVGEVDNNHDISWAMLIAGGWWVWFWVPPFQSHTCAQICVYIIRKHQQHHASKIPLYFCVGSIQNRNNLTMDLSLCDCHLLEWIQDEAFNR